MKLPRSGSSWITQKLNLLPGTYLAKEIVQHNETNGNYAAVEDHLRNALVTPSDKYSARTKWLLIGTQRFYDDYILNNKFLSPLHTLGFTLNPEHTMGIDWKNVNGEDDRRRSITSVIVLKRSNIVKVAISDYRGRLLKKICGESNQRLTSDQSSQTFGTSLRARPTPAPCVIPSEVPWDAIDLAREVTRWQDRYDSFEEIIKKNVLRKNEKPIVIYYESFHKRLIESVKLLLDGLEMRALGKETGGARHQGSKDEYGIQRTHNAYVPNTYSNTGISYSSLHPLLESASGDWEKRTSDDLQNVLNNFSSISWVFSDTSCKCLHAQLVDTEGKRFDRCDVRIQVSDDTRAGNGTAGLAAPFHCTPFRNVRKNAESAIDEMAALVI
jgi:hypothetical protein